MLGRNYPPAGRTEPYSARGGRYLGRRVAPTCRAARTGAARDRAQLARLPGRSGLAAQSRGQGSSPRAAATRPTVRARR